MSKERICPSCESKKIYLEGKGEEPIWKCGECGKVGKIRGEYDDNDGLVVLEKQ